MVLLGDLIMERVMLLRFFFFFVNKDESNLERMYMLIIGSLLSLFDIFDNLSIAWEKCLSYFLRLFLVFNPFHT